MGKEQSKERILLRLGVSDQGIVFRMDEPLATALRTALAHDPEVQKQVLGAISHFFEEMAVILHQMRRNQ